MVRVSTVLASSLLSAGVVSAASAPTCGAGSSCPESAPCCSEYGQCGVGAYCLGGCDPQYSFDLKSCAPAPTCKSADYKLDSLDGIQANTIYLGDASKANWVSQGRPVVYDDSVMLTMAPDTVGTLLSSTHYVWYGKISATMKSSAGQGVVTAFIMMSDVKDEIDFEFVGADLQAVQSNYYWQGVLDYHNSANLTVSNTDQDTHTYTIDWTPDQLTWSIDGNSMRTLKRSDTFNSTTNHYDYPQTPSRIMISLWPAGLSKNGEGTVDWAGGLIDWNSSDMTNGYYHAQVFDVSVECYDPPSGANVNGDSAYRYTSTAGTNNTVSITDDSSILASFYATGDDMSANPDAQSSQSAGASSTGAAAAGPTNVETVPGISGAGSRGTDTTGATIGGTATGSSGDGSSSDGNTGVTNGQFIQGNTPSGNTVSTGAAAGGQGERAVKGSIFAGLIALVALCAW